MSICLDTVQPKGTPALTVTHLLLLLNCKDGAIVSTLLPLGVLRSSVDEGTPLLLLTRVVVDSNVSSN